ncbi:hypothetical protein [Hydrocoleum sp. CS-953]|uniref:hypothetical protein n=1 Tax=Dapis sp. BLCC M172 TaxID=2975281 RepID=UPI000B9A365F|nr:hypothetical protein AFK68_10850 [Hydrocoleum sp. CS-953]
MNREKRGRNLWHFYCIRTNSISSEKRAGSGKQVATFAISLLIQRELHQLETLLLQDYQVASGR